MKPALFFFLVVILRTAISAGAVGPGAVKPQAAVGNVSYDETYERYPAPYDMFYHLRRLFPLLERNRMPLECQYLNEQNTTVLGGILPNFGAPLEKEPGALFTELYVKCLDAAFEVNLYPTAQNQVENLERLIGKDVIQAIPTSFFSSRTDVVRIKWVTLTNQVKIKILEALIENVAGPDEFLLSRNIIGDESVFGTAGGTKQQLLALVERKALERQPDAELWQVLRDVTILLRIGPTLLKH